MRTRVISDKPEIAHVQDIRPKPFRNRSHAGADVLAGYLSAVPVIDMAASAAEIRAIAAKVWDQDSHSEEDLAFLEAIDRADNEWHQQLGSANVTFGGGSLAWQAVKNLATRCQLDAYRVALAALEAADDLEFSEAAE